MPNIPDLLYQDSAGIIRTLIIGVLAYGSLIVLLRVSGKRTLSKMNAFDFIVTVALGSTLATILLSEGVALAEGVVAFAVLIFLQYAVTWLSVRSRRIREIVKADPVMLYYRGEFLPTMQQERVIQEEVYQAVRSQGIASMQDVEAVILETDGTFSALTRTQNATALQNVVNYPQREA